MQWLFKEIVSAEVLHPAGVGSYPIGTGTEIARQMKRAISCSFIERNLSLHDRLMVLIQDLCVSYFAEVKQAVGFRADIINLEPYDLAGQIQIFIRVQVHFFLQIAL